MATTRKFEWKPGWEWVKERKAPPGRCAVAQYRTAEVSDEKGTRGVFCCPKGTHFSKDRQGCVRGKGKARKPLLQALRHPVETFQQTHPRAWKKLSKSTGKKMKARETV